MMNDQEPHDRKLLETVTSRSLAPDEPLAPGQEELRGLWLAMGHALDKENAEFREADLLARLQSRPEFRVALPGRPAQATAVRARVWPALLSSAVALSLLLLVMQSSRFGGPTSVAVQPRSNGESAETWSDDELTWNDALDDELDAAQRAREFRRRAGRCR